MHIILLSGRILIAFTFAESSCNAGWPIQNREFLDSGDWTVVAPDHQFSCYGQVTQWHYLGKTTNGFKAIVWRPSSGSNTLYEVVGINDIPAGPVDIPAIYPVPERERIAVMPGDMIGFSFGPGVISFDVGGDYKINKTSGNLHATLQAGQVHDLSQYSFHREYSIAASVLKNGKYFDGYVHFSVSLHQFCVLCITWKENNLREWKHLIDSCTKRSMHD